MPIINVQLLSGRTPTQKASLIRELADGAVRALGVPEASVRVLLSEVSPEHWGIGARSKAEIEKGSE